MSFKLSRTRVTGLRNEFCGLNSGAWIWKLDRFLAQQSAAPDGKRRRRYKSCDPRRRIRRRSTGRSERIDHRQPVEDDLAVLHIFGVEYFAIFKQREGNDARIVEPESVVFGDTACFLVDFKRQWHDFAERLHIAQEDVDLRPRKPHFPAHDERNLVHYLRADDGHRSPLRNQRLGPVSLRDVAGEQIGNHIAIDGKSRRRLNRHSAFPLSLSDSRSNLKSAGSRPRYLRRRSIRSATVGFLLTENAPDCST